MHLTTITLREDRNLPLYASEDCQQLLKMYEEYYPTIGFNLPWVGYFIIRDDQIVGSCGFTGAPKDETVELAYWTFKSCEGQGVASFACRELIRIAREANPNIIITAKTAPEENASTRILRKNNFIFAGIVQDHEIGDAWLWRID